MTASNGTARPGRERRRPERRANITRLDEDGAMPSSADLAKPHLRLQAAAVATAFLLNGLTFGAWAARIPAVQAQTHLDEAGLGFALLGAAVGAVLTMSIGGWLGARFGTHVVTPITLLCCGMMLPLIGASFQEPRGLPEFSA